MSDAVEVQDPLKSPDQIYEPDDRQKYFSGTLAERHAYLASIVLNKSVPMDVKQLFETAKNLSLYSWFAYRFHQVSELIAFSALEMALRVRYQKEKPLKPGQKKRPPGLYDLLQYAKNNKWIVNEKFPSLYERAKYLAELNKASIKMKNHDFDKAPSMLVDEPEEEEILEAISKLDLVEAITRSANKIRNNLAHGSSTLHPNSTYTLVTVSEVINQVCP
ncbi:MAG: hypothetical protein OEW87_09140 [Flavobacteriaceae bacterium]|nr:hypothetical protein [Flavobacteriaceae bacterium]